MTKEELKKEAEEYALKQWEGNIPWSVIQKSYYDGAFPREKRIAELEKENKELKEKLGDILSLKDEELMCLETEFNTYKSEAKEIIKKLLLLPYANNEEVFADVTSTLDKAEQFLKEIEK